MSRFSFLKNKGENPVSAFTLIELLVVIAIIGLLASIVSVSLSSARAKTRDARRISDLRQIQKAVEMYYAANGQYPQPSRGWGQWSGHCPPYGDNNEYITGLAPTFIPSLPLDPKFDVTNYCYMYNASTTEYMIMAWNTMESICDGADADATKDPGDECNPGNIQQMDRTAYEQATIQVSSPGAANW